MRILLLLILLGALAAAQESWRTVRSSTGRFEVSLPGPARTSQESLYTSAGTLKQQQFLVNLGQRAFMVTYVDYPEARVSELGPGKVFENIREGVRADGATDLRHAELKLGQHPGCALSYRKEGRFWVKSRLYLVGRRLFQLTVSSQKPLDPAEVGRFFQSFRVLP